MGETQEVQHSHETSFTIHMGESQEVQLSKIANGAQETNSLEGNNFRGPMNETMKSKKKLYYRWFRIAIHSALVLVTSSAAVLLGRLYYEKGGKSKWMGTLVQLGGFPILLPYYLITAPKNLTTNNSSHPNQPSASMLAFVYVSIGLLLALDCYLYSVGLWYLPVSTYSLICSSQLAFNALFSYFLNSLKFTPYIVNSLILLTISSTLLVFQNESSSDDSDSTQISKKKYVIGFICTVGASAGYGLWLSLTQLVFKKVMKGETFQVVMDMIIYTSLVATCVTVVGLFASGEWNGLTNEMNEYELGKASYVLNLTFTATLWQLFTISCFGLIREVSSLFSNAISALGVPIVPILAVIFFHDKMHGIKAISMVLAIWGIISYVYQQYIDDTTSENTVNSHVAKPSVPEEEVHR
ncbi:purine permease 21 isoform X2 [Vigna radiata var. radiata]|uniref:Probable purine permease n=1 Tax=Vigna radiata var. radiata TaxID=3916 RepID=A0A1S3VX04_VIGRR|nr:purine permease 21 isoform X2 [Vigna radiata var. radiata]